MRIAQIAPLAESVPPKAYGGTERVVHWLTEALVERGHEVTLFASGDSKTSARLAPCCPRGLREAGVRDQTAPLLVALETVRAAADEFDLLHFHVDFLHFPMFGDLAGRSLTTLHGRLDLPEIHPVYALHRDMPLVSISDDQRRPMPPVNWMGTIHHGMPRDLVRFSPRSQGYLAFLGRIAPEKRVDRAIDIAIGAGRPLKIAAKVDPADEAYFETRIRPRLDHPLVEFVGEIGDDRKGEFLGGADALLFPVDWPEPFGLVMIEAMAAGTPVIAWRNGSVPEVIDAGETGVIVEDLAQAIRAVEPARALDRRAIRRRFEAAFTAERMAADYVAIYQRLLRAEPAAGPAAAAMRRAVGEGQAIGAARA